MDIMHPALKDVHVFILVFVRIISIMALLPIFGSAQVPVQLKVGLSLILAVLMMPAAQAHGAAVPVPRSMLGFGGMVVMELFVGLVIGFASMFLFAAVQFAGSLVDTETGFSFVQLVDPFTETATTALGQFKVIVFTIFFLLINGHYFLLLAIDKSFDLIPLLGVQAPAGKLSLYLTDMSARVFISAVKLAAPVFVTLLLTSIALGVVARTVPQLNVYFVGMPLTIAVGLGTTIIVLPMLAQVFRVMTDQLMRDLWTLLYLMAP